MKVRSSATTNTNDNEFMNMSRLSITEKQQQPHAEMEKI